MAKKEVPELNENKYVQRKRRAILKDGSQVYITILYRRREDLMDEAPKQFRKGNYVSLLDGQVFVSKNYIEEYYESLINKDAKKSKRSKGETSVNKDHLVEYFNSLVQADWQTNIEKEEKAMSEEKSTINVDGEEIKINNDELSGLDGFNTAEDSYEGEVQNAAVVEEPQTTEVENDGVDGDAEGEKASLTEEAVTEESTAEKPGEDATETPKESVAEARRVYSFGDKEVEVSMPTGENELVPIEPVTTIVPVVEPVVEERREDEADASKPKKLTVGQKIKNGVQNFVNKVKNTSASTKKKIVAGCVVIATVVTLAFATYDAVRTNREDTYQQGQTIKDQQEVIEDQQGQISEYEEAKNLIIEKMQLGIALESRFGTVLDADIEQNPIRVFAKDKNNVVSMYLIDTKNELKTSKDYKEAQNIIKNNEIKAEFSISREVKNVIIGNKEVNANGFIDEEGAYHVIAKPIVEEDLNKDGIAVAKKVTIYTMSAERDDETAVLQKVVYTGIPLDNESDDYAYVKLINDIKYSEISETECKNILKEANFNFEVEQDAIKETIKLTPAEELSVINIIEKSGVEAGNFTVLGYSNDAGANETNFAIKTIDSVGRDVVYHFYSDANGTTYERYISIDDIVEGYDKAKDVVYANIADPSLDNKGEVYVKVNPITKNDGIYVGSADIMTVTYTTGAPSVTVINDVIRAETSNKYNQTDLVKSLLQYESGEKPVIGNIVVNYENNVASSNSNTDGLAK